MQGLCRLAVVAVGFAILARAMGSVTDGGAIAGVLVAFVLMLAGGFSGFIPLLTLFVLTVISTAWGYKRKQRLGVAEHKEAARLRKCWLTWEQRLFALLPAIWFPELAELLLRCGGCRTWQRQPRIRFPANWDRRRRAAPT